MSNHDPATWPSGFGLGHGLAFIYLCFAFYTDDDLDDREITLIAQKLGEWGCVVDDGPAVTIETFEYWKACPDDTSMVHLINISGILREQLPEQNRIAVYGDLVQIAIVDGKVHQSEKDMLERMKELLGL